MAWKRKKNGRSTRHLERFAAIECFIMQSPAWRSLSLAARSAYVEMVALYDWSNNGRLALSARQLAARMPISRATATRAFQELTQKGFIAAVRPSGFNMKTGVRRATEWRLTRFKCDVTNDLPTRAFMKWKPKENHSAASPEDQSGFTTEPPSAFNDLDTESVAL